MVTRDGGGCPLAIPKTSEYSPGVSGVGAVELGASDEYRAGAGAALFAFKALFGQASIGPGEGLLEDGRNSGFLLEGAPLSN